MAANMTQPLPVAADRERVQEALNRAYNAVELVSMSVPGIRDLPAEDEPREVTYENIAELAAIIDLFGIELAALSDLQTSLQSSLTYLIWARHEQEDRRRRHDA